MGLFNEIASSFEQEFRKAQEADDKRAKNPVSNETRGWMERHGVFARVRVCDAASGPSSSKRPVLCTLPHPSFVLSLSSTPVSPPLVSSSQLPTPWPWT